MQRLRSRTRPARPIVAARGRTIPIGSIRRSASVLVGFVCLVVVAIHIPAAGLNEGREQEETQVIEGTLRRVGSEPFTRLVVTAADGTAGEVTDYILPDDAEAGFEPYIGSVVIVEGRVERRERTTVDGEYTVVEHHLVGPVIVSSE